MNDLQQPLGNGFPENRIEEASQGFHLTCIFGKGGVERGVSIDEPRHVRIFDRIEFAVQEGAEVEVSSKIAPTFHETAAFRTTMNAAPYRSFASS